MKKEKRTGRQPAARQAGPGLESSMPPWQQDLTAMGLFLVIILVLYSAVIFKGAIYEGGDSIENLTQTYRIDQHFRATGETPLWNPYPEAGTPNVFHLPKASFTTDYLVDWLGALFGTTLLFFMTGAAGMYLLLRRLKFGPFISFAATLAFILAPYYKSLIIVGQYMPAKFEAVMLLPWIVLTFLLCLEKMKVLPALLLALALGLQFQTQHYQVIWYTFVILAFLAIADMIPDVTGKRYRYILKKVVLLVIAGTIALLSASYTLLPAREFNRYTIRAQQAVDIAKNPAATARKGGVDPEFVRSWSMAPREFMDFLVPRASGGTTNELYEGKDYPELNGRIIPAYWGNMLFSGSLLYLGIPVLLSLLALFRYRERIVPALAATVLLLALWALGLNFQPFYTLCSAVLPFFGNFRTPPTSLAVVYFILALLSAYGMQYLLNDGNRNDRAFRKKVLYSLAAFFGLGVLFYLVGSQLDFSRSQENFDPAVLPVFQAVRKGFFFHDTARYFLVTAVFCGVVVLWLYGRIRQNHAILVVGLLIAADLVAVQSRYTDKPLPMQELKRKYFPGEGLASFFASDTTNYRVYAYTQSGVTFTSAVQSIQNNFDLQTLVPVYELFRNNLLHASRESDHMNWNVLRIFAVKYLVFDQKLDDPKLQLVFSDPERAEFVYTCRDPLPFAHFVKDSRVIPDIAGRLNAINDTAFNPSVTAILNDDPGPVPAPDSTSVKEGAAAPGRLEYSVFCSSPGLLVLSVPYLPGGWAVRIDGKPADRILEADHAMMAVVVPAGRHEVKAEFKPAIFTASLGISKVTSVILCCLILVLALLPLLLKGRLELPSWLA